MTDDSIFGTGDDFEFDIFGGPSSFPYDISNDHTGLLQPSTSGGGGGNGLPDTTTGGGPNLGSGMLDHSDLFGPSTAGTGSTPPLFPPPVAAGPTAATPAAPSTNNNNIITSTNSTSTSAQPPTFTLQPLKQLPPAATVAAAPPVFATKSTATSGVAKTPKAIATATTTTTTSATMMQVLHQPSLSGGSLSQQQRQLPALVTTSSLVGLPSAAAGVITTPTSFQAVSSAAGLITTPSSFPTVSSTAGQLTSSSTFQPVVSAVAASPAAATLTSIQQPVMTLSAAATPLQGSIIQQSPILIQQPNPLIIMKPTVSSAAPVISVSQQQTTPGPLLLQQQPSATVAHQGSLIPAASSVAATTAQPQVIWKTPQGRHTLQQVQTSTGTKLIAVPVGSAAATAVAAGTATATFAQAPPAGQIVSLPAVPTMGGLGLPTSQPMQVIPASPVVSAAPSTPSTSGGGNSSKKEKRSRKRKKDRDSLAAQKSSALEDAKKQQQQQQQQQQQSEPSKTTQPVLDLGELMKDVGLDQLALEALEAPPDANATIAALHAASDAQQPIAQQHPTPMQFTQQIVQPANTGLPNTQQPTLIATAAAQPSGNQLVSQIQQPLPFQSQQPGGFQLVQGSDGNFTILSTQPAPQAISCQPTIIGTGLGPAAAATMVQPTPTPQLTTSTVIQDQQQPGPSTSSAAGAVAAAAAASPAKPATPTPTPPKVRRLNPDPSRIPLAHDSRLPQGWHRKVSQRKSGASAGRYEVFIIGPTGKRFRSRNELKAYIEKTGNNSFDPDDFDFSTFGTNNITSGRQPPTPPGIPPDASTITPTRSAKSKTSAAAVASRPSPKVHLPDVVPTTSPGLCSPNTPQQPQLPQQPQPPLQLPQQPQQLPQQLPLQPQQQVPQPMQQTTTRRQHMSGGTLTVQHIQQPVPPDKMFSSMPSTSNMAPADLVQKLQDPLPPSSISSINGSKDGSGSSSSSSKPPFSSQLSMDINKADETIEILLNWRKQNPNKQLEVSVDKTQDILNSMTGLTDMDKPVAVSTSSSPDSSSGGIQANFLNTLASTSSSSNTLSQLLPQPAMTVAPGLSSVTTQGLTLGGSQSQIIALSQNLPQNTQMVKGPNGVPHSLSTATNTVSTYAPNSHLASNLIVQPTKIPVSKPEPPQQQQAVYATGTIRQSLAAPPPPVGATGSVQQQQFLSTGSGAPGVIRAPTQLPAIGKASLSATDSPLGGAAIPPLTDKQKKIVAEFKQKLMTLPEKDRPAYQAQHKATLIKQLDFQPSQIQQLQQQRQPRPPDPRPTLNQVSQVQHLQQPMLNPTIPTVIGAATALPQVRPTAVVPTAVPTIRQPVVRLPTQPQPPEKVMAPAPLLLGQPEPPTPARQRNRAQLIAWVESQLRKDQNEAVNPNYKAEFGTREDACKRLLRYHVFDDIDPDPAKVAKEEADFEDKSTGLLSRFQSLVNKYHSLLIKESMRSRPTSEEVMLARGWDSDEKQLLRQEREIVMAGGVLDDLHDLSEEDRDRYKDLISKEKEAKEEELPKAEAMGFLGLKFSKNPEEAGYLPAPKEKEGGKEDSEEEFGLPDTARVAVGSILEGDGDSNSSGNPVRSNIDLFGGSGDYGVGDGDSVQNAINSILDNNLDSNRMDTPDMDNFAGFLDSIDDVTSSDNGQDAVTEAAVNSIPRF